jgi:hypothetical protein
LADYLLLHFYNPDHLTQQQVLIIFWGRGYNLTKGYESFLEGKKRGEEEKQDRR